MHRTRSDASSFRLARPLRFVSWLIILCAMMHGTGSVLSASVAWSHLPSLPDEHGFGGPFAGVTGNALVVAGGANFPNGSPWTGGVKVWHGDAYVLTSPEGQWQRFASVLPRPLAYGASVSWKDMLVCIGGGDSERHYSDVFALVWDGTQIRTESLPSLPQPLAFHCAALIGDTIYVAGGSPAPDATEALKLFLALDLSKTEAERKWRKLDPWPGPERVHAVAGAMEGSFYLFTGARLVARSDGMVGREYLQDAYRYDPSRGWSRVADLPRPAVAAPSPAVALGVGHLAVFGGDTGEHFDQVSALQQRYPDFSDQVLAYHAVTDAWSERGRLLNDVPPGQVPDPQTYTSPPVTTATASWRGRIAIPSGEVRPSIRTTRVLWGTPDPIREPFGIINYVVIGVYLALMVVIGLYFSARESTTDDFFRGGKRIPWWAAGLSIFGTQLSAITFMAMPAKVFASDWSYFFAAIMIVAIAPLIVYFYLPFFRRLDVTSAYEYLEKRFNPAARLTGSTAFLLLQLGRMGIVLYLPSLALSAVTGIDIFVCILIMGVVATLYTVLGGIEAVIWTDVVQVVILLGGALVSLIIMTVAVDGGIGRIISMASAEDKFRMIHMGWDASAAVIWVVLLGMLGQNIVSYTSDQTVIQRYLTTRDEKQAARSIWTNAAITIPSTLIFFFTGTAMWAFYRTRPEELSALTAMDQVYPWFIAHQLPDGVSGLVIAALFAASMSSLDSSMNSMAASISTDWYQRFAPHTDERRRLRFAKGVTVVLGVLGTATAVFMAANASVSMWDEFLRIIGLFGGGLAGMFAAGIFTRRVDGVAVMVGFFASAALLAWVQLATNLHLLLFPAIGIGSCIAVAYTVSFVTPRPDRPLDGLTLYTRNQVHRID